MLPGSKRKAEKPNFRLMKSGDPIAVFCVTLRKFCILYFLHKTNKIVKKCPFLRILAYNFVTFDGLQFAKYIAIKEGRRNCVQVKGTGPQGWILIKLGGGHIPWEQSGAKLVLNKVREINKLLFTAGHERP